jgi:hypothetical protein
LPGVGVLRYTTSLMAAAALFILAISVVVVRTAALGRRLGYRGLAGGAVILGAVLAQYGAFTTPLAILSALGHAVALWRAPAAEETVN